MESAITWFVPMAALAAFGSPHLVAKHRPDLYRPLFYVLLIGGNIVVMLANGAWTFYNIGYREALQAVGSDMQPERLWGVDPILLAGATVCFWVFLFGVWFYGRIAVKPDL